MDFQLFKEKYQKVKPEEYTNSVISNPLVSICIQTYEHVNFIRDCLNSIIKQKTNFTFEVLIGDDESTDGTKEICLEYARKYPDKIRLFLHKRENNITIDGNPTGRFNYLYNLFSARGKYIALCDGDDYWLDPYKLQNQLDFLENNHEYALSCTGFNELSKNGFITPVSPKFTRSSFINLIEGNYILSSSVLFRSTLLPDRLPEWFTNVFVGDWLLFLLVTRNGGLIHCNKTQTVLYRKDIGVFQNYRNNKLRMSKVLNMMEYILYDPLFYLKRKQIKKSIYNTKLNIMALHNKEGEFMNSLLIFFQLFLSIPVKAMQIYLYSIKLYLGSKFNF